MSSLCVWVWLSLASVPFCGPNILCSKTLRTAADNRHIVVNTVYVCNGISVLFLLLLLSVHYGNHDDEGDDDHDLRRW